jgi:Cu/Ag efflux protein CusF
MGRRLFIAMGLFFGVVLALPALEARQKDSKTASGQQDRIDGNVHMIDKTTKIVTVKLRGQTTQREVIYDDKTAFTFRNKPSTLDEVKEGTRIIAVGKNNDKNQLVATRIEVRETTPK